MIADVDVVMVSMKGGGWGRGELDSCSHETGRRRVWLDFDMWELLSVGFTAADPCRCASLEAWAGRAIG